MRRYSGAYCSMPVQWSHGIGIFWFVGISTSKFWTNAATIKNNAFLENVSPAHNRLPEPNGSDLSNFGENWPDSSKNRSGLNWSGWCHVCSSLCDPYNDPKTIAPCKRIPHSTIVFIIVGICSILYFWNVISLESCIGGCCMRQTRWNENVKSKGFSNRCFNIR